jgi:hypothetical protein
MGELINLHKARKQARRQEEESRAAANRIVHGRSKAERTLDATRSEHERRKLEAHKIDTGDAT